MKTIKLFLFAAFTTTFLSGCSGGLAGLADSILYPFDQVNKHYSVPEIPPEGLGQIKFDVAATNGKMMSIHAWTYESPNPGARVMVHFHGNGENLGALSQSGFIDILKQLDIHFIIIDYPGLGRSTHKPNQENLVNSALAAIDWARQKYPQSPLVVWGRSLGAAVAALSTARAADKVDGLIMTSPWNNFLAVAKDKSKLASSLPKEWVEQNRYDSAAAVSTLVIPTIIHHGLLDKVIPIKFGRVLYQAFPANGHAIFKEFADKEHNDIFTEPVLWQDIRTFLK